MKEIKVKMAYNKSTPGTHVYNAEDKKAQIPTLYIRKDGEGEPSPSILVTVTEIKP